MESIIVQRLKSRMEEMGKNPSSLALEANLGRSAVRDIVSGRAKNPQYATLLSLASALDCSLAYLTGEIDTPYKDTGKDLLATYDPKLGDIHAILEAGVYRHQSYEINPFSVPVRPYKDAPNQHLIYQDLRAPSQYLRLFQMGDMSQSEAGILEGDILTSRQDWFAGSVSLTSGMLVICRHQPDGIDAYELSARFVKETRQTWELICHSGVLVKPIILPKEQEDNKSGLMNRYLNDKGETVDVEGVTIRITRSLPIIM